MNTSRRNHSIRTILFLGTLLLGTGIVSWAIYHIYDQSTYATIPVYLSSTDMISNSVNTGDQPGLDSQKEQKDESGISEATITPIPVPEKSLYTGYPLKGEIIGSLTIPDLDKVLPILEGTSEEELKNGVGHFAGSGLPGEKNNCVLSGHRDSVFIGVGDLVLGDKLIVQTSAGTFIYKITKIRIVHKDDTTIIVPSDHAILTLTTCYPFIFVGHAPDRYIITADMVNNTEYQ